jgi:16S rRNA C967 or C1407 C5-methylase (RsmB/RsmF family)
MREHLDPDVLRKIHFSKRDGSLWGRKQPGSQHKILVDAPCTGERHLIENSRELAQWSPARGRRHQVRQAALLISAIDAARSGGLIVYSTCSLSRVENESVIERALGKRPGLAVEEPLRDSAFEAAARGGYVLPDRMNGCGPMYAAVLRRVTSNPSETS